jgi:Conserved in the green lineage and diatoms 27
MRESFVEFCPVPSEQQPINEYEQLKESWFFSWATLTPLNYSRKLIWVWFWSLFISAPIAAASFSPSKAPFQFILCSGGGAVLFVIFVLIRLYLGWSYVGSRLQDDRIFYEESGWYDGQIWDKPDSILNRDRLIVSYQIEPIVTRLKKTGIIIAILLCLGTLTWFLT